MDADVIVIGSGQAGVPLAARLARPGAACCSWSARRWRTCVNTGCTPTKTMVASARAPTWPHRRPPGRAHRARGSRLAAVVDRKDAMVRRWRDGVDKRLRRAGSRRTCPGPARFVGEQEVEVDGEKHRAPNIIVNRGTRPACRPSPGWATSPSSQRHGDGAPRGPAHLVVLGGGYIGC